LNLIIEQGNTTTKIAIFDRWDMINMLVCKEFDVSKAEALFKQYPLVNGIYSTVKAPDCQLMDSLKKQLAYFLMLDSHTALPLRICYETPQTLGSDRIAAATGANYLRPGRNVLVIDAGTAITYEVIEATGVYIGGNISPGMETRFKALHQFTDKLPCVEVCDNVPLWGTSTETAILAGVVNGMVYEMDGYIDEMQKKYSDVFVFLTGGHSFYFERRLKNTIFADANLVMVGLNRILEYNVEKQ